jgi:hypothetical protein
MTGLEPLFALIDTAPSVRAGAYELDLGGRRFLVVIAEFDLAFGAPGAPGATWSTAKTGGAPSPTLEPLASASEVLSDRDRGGAPPYLPLADVALLLDPTLHSAVRLRVGRGTVATVDKVGTAAAFTEMRPDRAAFATVSARGVVPVAELPPNVDWSTFQRAPVDQRAAWLVGDEWIEVDVASPQGKPLRLFGVLPEVHLRCLVQHSAFVGEHARMEPILALDRLVIDPARHRVTLSGRCHLELVDRGTLEATQVTVALSLRGAEIEWPLDEPLDDPPSRRSLPGAPVTVPPKRFSGTVILEGAIDTLPAPIPGARVKGTQTVELPTLASSMPPTLPFRGETRRRVTSAAPKP